MDGSKAPRGWDSLNLSKMAFKYSVVTRSVQGPPTQRQNFNLMKMAKEVRALQRSMKKQRIEVDKMKQRTGEGLVHDLKFSHVDLCRKAGQCARAFSRLFVPFHKSLQQVFQLNWKNSVLETSKLKQKSFCTCGYHNHVLFLSWIQLSWNSSWIGMQPLISLEVAALLIFYAAFWTQKKRTSEDKVWSQN